MEERRQTLPIVLAVALAVGILLGLFIGRGRTSRSSSLFPTGSSRFDEVMSRIETEYVDTVNWKEIEEAGIVAMMDKLDPHSQYVSLSEFNAMNDPLLGSFEGIGVSFRLEKDTVAIVSTIKGGPSEHVGIKAGDRIIYVDDSLIAGVKMKNEDVMRKLKGPKSTKVAIKVLRRGEPGLLDFTIQRDVIPTYSVDVAYMLDDEIGYLKLGKFSATTYQEFVKAVKTLRAEGMKKLIFDLRGNTGGYLNAAVDVADEFLPKGSLIVYTEGRSRPRNYMKAHRHGLLEKTPVAVLIDGESASASEIVAGALQDNDRGIIVGRRSFGKGLVQEQMMLSDQSAIRLTVARYHTPTGRSIQKPFDEDHEKYLYESFERFENGEIFHADSIHFADSLKYVTPKGKIVYGGGGIMPDVYVPLVDDSTEYFFTRIVNTGILFQYAFDYADGHRPQLERYKTVDRFIKSFSVNDAMFNEILKSAETKGLKGNHTEIEMARRKTEVLLKAYIAREIYGDEGFYPIYEQMDDILKRAMQELKTPSDWDVRE